jgi:hypothetical protein
LTEESQHQTCRISVLGMFHGAPTTDASSGLAGKTFHLGGYGTPAVAASLKTIWPVYVFGASHANPSTKSHVETV